MKLSRKWFNRIALILILIYVGIWTAAAIHFIVIPAFFEQSENPWNYPTN